MLVSGIACGQLCVRTLGKRDSVHPRSIGTGCLCSLAASCSELPFKRTQVNEGFPGGTKGKESACQYKRCYKRCGFDPWVWKIPRSRKWQPIPVFLPGKSHGQRSLAGYSSWGHKESDITKQAYMMVFNYFK